jgi:serine/threonine protein phosphatase PrpC
MLSLVFTNALEREFSDGNDKHAFAAVNAMQSAIAQSFGESDEAVDIDHGCDLVFLDIDRDQKQIEVVFAGLGLIHWHAVELRAQAFASPRGGISADADCLRGIQRNVISYRPGDRLLLATDGVTDQLCQQTPTRGFGYRRLQEVFAANAQLPLDQCIVAIRDRLQGWQGAQVRRDDVTIIALDLK